MTDPSYVTRWLFRLVALAVVVSAGCAAGRGARAPAALSESSEREAEPLLGPGERQSMADDLLTLDTRLNESMGAGGTANCDEARRLRDRICELACKICVLADRHPEERSLRDQCADGRMRCERATRAVGDRCD